MTNLVARFLCVKHDFAPCTTHIGPLALPEIRMGLTYMLYSLHERTLELARNRPHTLTLNQIAQDTGLNHWWVKRYCNGTIPEASVNRVETLYSYLSGKQLDLS